VAISVRLVAPGLRTSHIEEICEDVGGLTWSGFPGGGYVKRMQQLAELTEKKL
jgi:hypothetical protein